MDRKFNYLIYVGLLLALFGCQRTLSFPKLFIAPECFKDQKDCLAFKEQLVPKHAIYKPKIQRAALTTEGFKIYLSPESIEATHKMKRDYFGQKLLIVFNDKIISQDMINNTYPIDYLSIPISASIEGNLKACLELTSNCNKDEMLLTDKANKETSELKNLAMLKNKEFLKLTESLNWIPLHDQMYTYDKEGTKKLKTFNPRTLSFRQKFDLEKNQFSYHKNMIEFDFGWVKRVDIAPENILSTKQALTTSYSKFYVDYKCLQKDVLTAESLKAVQHFLKANMRSNEVAYELVAKSKLNTVELEKNLDKIKCP